ncbi:MAG: WD40/YVTN/BNR-like repeat-containing protein [Nostocoides sp.]
MAKVPIQILLGTTKGAFILDGDATRSTWSVRGPFCDGWPINHVIADQDTGTIWAGGGGDFSGAGVWSSTDDGLTWSLTKLTAGEMDRWAANDPEFAASIGWQEVSPPFADEFAQVWSLARVGNRLYAGTKPAKLLVSEDDGETWDAVKSLTDHPSAAQWNPGAAGLVLHTIIADPAEQDIMWVGISAAGVFGTTDGGATWERRNDLANPDVTWDGHPAGPRDGQVGWCVHNLVRAPGPGPGVLYQQNHQGVWASQDGGLTWADATAGLPSRFGFPIHVHPRDPRTLWTLPLNGDTEGRFPPGAAAAVWHSTDGGASWQAQRDGLPQQSCYFTVLRQAMAGDRADPAGVYFGTNSGSVFASSDEGASWREIARHLPTICSVEVRERS